MSRLFNDRSGQPPRLSVYLNLGTLLDLRPDSAWPGLEDVALYQQLKEDGFQGVQLIDDCSPPPAALLPYCGLNRINTPAEADVVAAKHAARGDGCLTVHAGWGLEDDNEVFRLVEAILAAADKHCLPIFIETHRATITQDLWRTVQITKMFPEVRFNGDFSHYSCGQELVYSDWAQKLGFMTPIFERVGFLHGRIASPGCMQVSIDADLTSRPRQAHGAANYLEHFKELWTRAISGFLRIAAEGDLLIFAPELLASTHYYARLFPDSSAGLAEESDRYTQALLYKELAHACFADAKAKLLLRN